MGNALCGGGGRPNNQGAKLNRPTTASATTPLDPPERLGTAKYEATYGGKSINTAPPLDPLPSLAIPEPDPPPPKSTFVIAIDFGTTYSGAAYCPFTSTATSRGSLSEMRTIANTISVVKTWPNQTNFFTEKTPTVLSYGQDPPAWGWSVKSTDTPRVEFFKLGLEEDIAIHYSASSSPAATGLGGFLADPNWHHPSLPDKHPVDYATAYLARLNHHLSTQVFVNRFGSTFLQNQQLSYVITVPAIWSDKAKALTRSAAVNAGIASDSLTLITEPEAAALYCATLCNEVDLGPGDRFLICDAGGGTVDLIAYQVLSLDPFKVDECTVGTGAACGAIYLDQAFETLILSKFDSAGLDLGQKRLAGLRDFFATTIKHRFNPFDAQVQSEYDFNVGLPDNPTIDLKDGYLTLKKRDIEGVFEPVFLQILDLIRGQLDRVREKEGKTIKTCFLVGGLGSSLYLLDFLRTKLKQLDVKQPDVSYTAIMKGAVLYKLGLDLVRTRDGVHPDSRKVFDYDGLARCDGYMHWFAKKGHSIDSGTISEKTIYSDYHTDSLATAVLWISEDDDPPQYMDKRVMKHQVKLTVDLKNLPRSAWEVRKGVNGTYRRVRYELGLTFGPGGIEWRFLYQGKVMGSVTSDYV